MNWVDAHDQKLYKDEPWDQLVEVVEFIDDGLSNGKHVVVHCAAGRSRSSTAVIAYLLAKGVCDSYEACLAYCKAERPQVEPNDGFVTQLKAFMKSSDFEAVAMRIRE